MALGAHVACAKNNKSPQLDKKHDENFFLKQDCFIFSNLSALLTYRVISKSKLFEALFLFMFGHLSGERGRGGVEQLLKHLDFLFLVGFEHFSRRGGEDDQNSQMLRNCSSSEMRA